MTGIVNGKENKVNKTQQDINEIESANEMKNMLKKYKKTLFDFSSARNFQVGTGIYYKNPHQLIDRLELLIGSINAGNNGVIPEFLNIVHNLNKNKLINKEKLNSLINNI